MSLSVTQHGLDAILSELGRLGAVIKHPRRAMTKIGLKVRDKAQDLAPIGPTDKDLKALRKTKGKTHRKPGSTSRPKPGSLQSSITFEAGDDQVAIRVPSNSPAGKYAYAIHSEKGKRWRKRGPGTVRKGPQADEKFIDRAVEALARDGTIETILRSEINKQAGI